jgi:hypothetical protein
MAVLTVLAFPNPSRLPGSLIVCGSAVARIWRLLETAKTLPPDRKDWYD